MSYAIHHSQSDLSAALALCRGTYQRNLILGYEALSGATLRGAAKKWGCRYAASRCAVLKRITGAGIRWSETTGNHNKRILVIGLPSVEVEALPVA